MHRQTRMLGPGGAVQRRQTRLDGRIGWLPERWGDLHRLHHARIPGQIHAVYEPTSRVAAVFSCSTDLWQSHSRVAKVYASFPE